MLTVTDIRDVLGTARFTPRRPRHRGLCTGPTRNSLQLNTLRAAARKEDNSFHSHLSFIRKNGADSNRTCRLPAPWTITDTLTIAACLKVLAAALCGRGRYQDFKHVRQLAETWTSRDIAETPWRKVGFKQTARELG